MSDASSRGASAGRFFQKWIVVPNPTPASRQRHSELHPSVADVLKHIGRQFTLILIAETRDHGELPCRHHVGFIANRGSRHRGNTIVEFVKAAGLQPGETMNCGAGGAE